MYRLPKTNTGYWQQKIQRNKERDRQEQQRLAEMGWHCITVWECQLKPAVRQQTLEALAFTLNGIYLGDHRIRRYQLPEEERQMAAEDISEI